MRVVTDHALLRPGVLGDHDLTLLQRPPCHPFVAEGAELPCVGRHDHLEAGRVIGPGRRRFEHAAILTLAGGAVADLAFDDFSDVHAVVDALEPVGDLLRMARRAIPDALVFGLVGGDLRNRIAAIVAVLVE